MVFQLKRLWERTICCSSSSNNCLCYHFQWFGFHLHEVKWFSPENVVMLTFWMWISRRPGAIIFAMWLEKFCGSYWKRMHISVSWAKLNLPAHLKNRIRTDIFHTVSTMKHEIPLTSRCSEDFWTSKNIHCIYWNTFKWKVQSASSYIYRQSVLRNVHVSPVSIVGLIKGEKYVLDGDSLQKYHSSFEKRDTEEIVQLYSSIKTPSISGP